MQDPKPKPLEPLKRSFFARLTAFFRDYTEGLSQHEVRRLFDEDATRAIRILSEDGMASADGKKTKKDEFAIFLHTVRRFFIGLAFKLSPARRLLFAVALFLPLLGFLDVTSVLGREEIRIDFSPLWFVLSTAGLTWLLALELVDRLRVRDELEVARHLQRDMMPHSAPQLPGYSIAHSYRTANEIGGDYYDFLPLEDGRLVLTVGDASGHGIGAGLLMAIANATLKSAADLDPRPRPVLEALNRVLLRTGGKRAFMTLFWGVLEPATGHFEYAGAGHPFPLLRRTHGEVIELGRGALPLGLREGLRFSCATTTIEPGDLLVLYSDGLPEAIGGLRDDAFGFDRLQGLLQAPGTPLQVHDRILAALDGHLQQRSLTDDFTLVVLSRHLP